MPKIYRTLELKSRIQNSKLKKCVPFENLPNPKFGFINRIENFRTPSFLKLSLPCRPSLKWAAHGTSLVSSYQLKYNRFIILAVDQDVQSATGCSIDASVEFINP
jgi:hypothetical protein